MEEMELTFKRTMPVWWAFAWRAVLVFMLASLVLGLLIGVVEGITGSPPLSIAVSSLHGFLVLIPGSIWALKAALSKAYGNYSIVLVKRSS